MQGSASSSIINYKCSVVNFRFLRRDIDSLIDGKIASVVGERLLGEIMRPELLALYGGPDQIMTITSGLASALGLLLIFWNKVVALFFRVVKVFRRSPEPDSPEIQKSTNTH